MHSRVSFFAAVLLCLGALPLSTHAAKVVGPAREFALDIVLPDGRVSDMVLLEGTGVTVDPDPNQYVRVYFLDVNDDMVIVEFTGAGSLQVDFESFTGPAMPVKYNQLVSYVKGHAFVMIAAPDSTSNLKIYSVGPANSINQALFREGVVYDGVADLHRVTIVVGSPGPFGTLDLENVRFSGSSGAVGISASDVTFTSSVSLHDIDASGTAIPVLVFGSLDELRVLGGDLSQTNARPVVFTGVSDPTFAAGTTTHGEPLLVSGSFEVGSFGSLNVRSVSTANPTFGVAQGQLPSWASLNAGTGTISGTPDAVGYSRINVQISDDVSVIPVEVEISVDPAPVAPTFTLQPGSSNIVLGGQLTLSAGATGTPAPSYQWRKNGIALANGVSASLTLADFQPDDAGLYSVVATNTAGSVESSSVWIGAVAPTKVAGAANEVGPDIVHTATGKRYDQILLTGASAIVKAEDGDVTRISFLDLDHDIVQVEFSGAGSLTLTLDQLSAAARPINYNQAVDYVRGHARILITGADETSNVTIFTVGRITALNPALFRDEVTYDGVADIASLSIRSANGKFGGVRTANASYSDIAGTVGLYAPDVEFLGPVFVGDVSASEDATPKLVLGSASDVRITGGDLEQPNGRSVVVSGISTLQFRNGSTSHGDLFLARQNKGVLLENGVDRTAQIATAPTP